MKKKLLMVFLSAPTLAFAFHFIIGAGTSGMDQEWTPPVLETGEQQEIVLAGNGNNYTPYVPQGGVTPRPERPIQTSSGPSSPSVVQPSPGTDSVNPSGYSSPTGSSMPSVYQQPPIVTSGPVQTDVGSSSGRGGPAAYNRPQSSSPRTSGGLPWSSSSFGSGGRSLPGGGGSSSEGGGSSPSGGVSPDSASEGGSSPGGDGDSSPPVNADSSPTVNGDSSPSGNGDSPPEVSGGPATDSGDSPSQGSGGSSPGEGDSSNPGDEGSSPVIAEGPSTDDGGSSSPEISGNGGSPPTIEGGSSPEGGGPTIGGGDPPSGGSGPGDGDSFPPPVIDDGDSSEELPFFPVPDENAPHVPTPVNPRPRYAVPEPGTFVLLGAGLAGLLWVGRRMKKR
ncbi:MAG: PEP-CTERM sorting domain-containing protein [Desulfobacteraceae bacterium]|nr:MAG: PEP-CTERM sorting domain-containing protein [Desulfobacteraceae bacterium]